MSLCVRACVSACVSASVRAHACKEETVVQARLCDVCVANISGVLNNILYPGPGRRGAGRQANEPQTGSALLQLDAPSPTRQTLLLSLLTTSDVRLNCSCFSPTSPSPTLSIPLSPPPSKSAQPVFLPLPPSLWQSVQRVREIRDLPPLSLVKS